MKYINGSSTKIKGQGNKLFSIHTQKGNRGSNLNFREKSTNSILIWFERWKSLPAFRAAENDTFDKQRSKSGRDILLRGTLRLGL